MRRRHLLTHEDALIDSLCQHEEERTHVRCPLTMPAYNIKIVRYEEAIENVRRFDSRNSLAKNPILFVGSSSIVFWETSQPFPEFPIINRGFGGASFPEIIHYCGDVIKKHAPSKLVIVW